jgi:hypothetical protein
MLFGEEICLLWSSVELFMAVTHLFVLLGIRNPKLTFIRTQKNYFLLDAMIHMTNLLLYFRSEKSIPMIFCLCLWSIMLVGHIRYFLNLHRNPPLSQRQRLRHQGPIPNDSHKISRIFHWSSVDFEENRFHIGESGKEILETSADITAHSAGFLFAFQNLLSFRYRVLTFIIMIALLYRQMLNLPHFINEPKMMPLILRKLNNLISNQPSTMNSKQS